MAGGTSRIANLVKAVNYKTVFGVSTDIITFFVGGTSRILDSIMEAANCNTKLTKQSISVAV